MATNIDKSLYYVVPPAPQPNLMDEAMLEIEIEGPGEDGLEITLEVEEAAAAFGDNLAETMAEDALQTLAGDLLELVDADINSRKDWVQAYVDGLEVLGLKYEERTEPWNGACGVYSPLLAESAIRFQSEMITETFPAQGPVKTQIVGAINRLRSPRRAR